MTSTTLFAAADARANTSLNRAKVAIFADPKSQLLLEQIERVAAAAVAVMITGETGTGKEIVARHVHECSGRTGPFVAVNCGALSASMADAELFGHQAGSFTGATETRAGWFEAANHGTLFLDEIGDLPLPLQVKLLRVLQEREVVRIGSRKAIPIDVRLIAATNVNLARAVANQTFRQDLYYRLNVATFDLPPLRARRGDIAPLVAHFIQRYAGQAQMALPVVTPEAASILESYDWPGNIRELENVVHLALIVANEGVIRPENLRFPDRTPQQSEVGSARTPFEQITAELARLFVMPPPNLYQKLEDLVLERAFDYCRRNQVHTARLLGISRNILRTHLKRAGLIGVVEEVEGGDCHHSSEPLQGAQALM